METNHQWLILVLFPSSTLLTFILTRALWPLLLAQKVSDGSSSRTFSPSLPLSWANLEKSISLSSKKLQKVTTESLNPWTVVISISPILVASNLSRISQIFKTWLTNLKTYSTISSVCSGRILLRPLLLHQSQLPLPSHSFENDIVTHMPEWWS